MPCAAASLAILVAYAVLRSAPAPSEHPRDALAVPTEKDLVRGYARVAALRSGRTNTPSGNSTETERWVKGTVTTATGDVIDRAEVCLVSQPGHRDPGVRCTRTGASGAFRLLAGAGKEVLTAAARQHSTQSRTVPASGDLPPFDFILNAEQPPNVSGIVVDASGGPVSGAAVFVQRRGIADPVASTWSDANGRFRTFVAPGGVTLTAQAESYAPAMARIDAPAESITLVVAAGSTLMGEVVDDGTDEPVAAVLVSASAGSALHGATIEVTTDQAGRFQMTGLHAGTYELTATAQRWGGGASSVTLGVADISEGVQLRVRPATTLSAVIRVSGKACASGRLDLQGPANLGASTEDNGELTIGGVLPGLYKADVYCPGSIGWSGELEVGTEPLLKTWDLNAGSVVSGRVERANGEPLAGAHVGIVARASGEIQRRSTSVGCVSDEAGNFECGGLAPGDYTIRLGRDPVSDPPAIVVTSDGASAAPLVLRARPMATILAQMEGAQPARLGTFEVLARAANEFPVSAGVAPDGHARFDLPLGQYAVYLGPTSGVPRDVRQVVLSADGETVEVRVPVPELLEISGVVLDEAGFPVPDEWVFAESTAIEGTGQPLGAPALTSERGEFTVQDVIPGAYRILTDRSRTHRTQEAVQAGARDVVLRLPE